MDEQEAHIEQTSRSIPRVEVPYYIRGLALGLPAYLIGIHLWTWLFLLPVFLGGRADFRQLYIGGYMLRTGHAHELYDYMAQKRFEDLLVSPAQVALPVNHLAYEELLFMPFSLMSYRTAYFAFLAFNLLLLAGADRQELFRLEYSRGGNCEHGIPSRNVWAGCGRGKRSSQERP